MAFKNSVIVITDADGTITILPTELLMRHINGSFVRIALDANTAFIGLQPRELGTKVWNDATILATHDGVDKPQLAIISPNEDRLALSSGITLEGCGALNSDTVIDIDADIINFAAPVLAPGQINIQHQVGITNSLTVQRVTGSTIALAARIQGDANNRGGIRGDGRIVQGDGTNAVDVGISYISTGFSRVNVGDISTNRFVRKTANESVTLSTVLQNDNDLVLALAANATYLIEGFLIFTANGGDIKFAFTEPTSATMHWVSHALAGAAFSRDYQDETSTATADDRASTSSKAVIKFTGSIVTTNAGNLQLQWAQNVSDGDQTTVYAGSWFRAQRVE